MAWIKTISLAEADGELLEFLTKQRELYPIEYALPAPKASATGESIVESHTLIPDALYHAFATFGALLSPDLPLTRRQHEMIRRWFRSSTSVLTDWNLTQSFCVA